MTTARTYTYAVLGNTVVDAIAHVDEAFLARFALRKGDSNAISHSQMVQLSGAVSVEHFRGGGAAANTAYTLARLGTPVAFVGLVGADPAGRFFAEDMLAAGVTLSPPRPSHRTTDVFTLLTADGVRTMAQSVPPPPSPDDSWVEDDFIEQAGCLIIEAYAAAAFPAATAYAAQLAARAGTQLVVSLTSPRAVQGALSILIDLITAHQPLVIGNVAEWALLAAGADAHTLRKLERTERVLTRSGEGATYYGPGGTPVVDSPTQPIPKPTDLTGAGDAFAAGFLHVFLGGGSPQLALQNGHQLGRAVVLQLGPRLQSFPSVETPQTD